MKLFNIEDFKQLFEDVQLQRLMSDQKTFADSIPKREMDEILNDFERLKDEANFNLKEFVNDNFNFSNYPSPINKIDTIDEYIERQWDYLTKSADENNGSLIALPHSYVVPGGRFSELFYWDSYFTMLGLQESKRWDLIVDMIDNFAYLIDRFGFIPNGNRTYFLSRSQPPFFSYMVSLLAESIGDEAYLKYYSQLESEYEFWMDGKLELSSNKTLFKQVVSMPDGSVLNRYCDRLNKPRTESYFEDFETAKKSLDLEIFRHLRSACASGWDFSSRWYDGTDNELHYTRAANRIPVDLNCLLFNLEKTLCHAARLKGDLVKSSTYADLALSRKNSIERYLWNEQKGEYQDYDFQRMQLTQISTLAMVFPLFVNISSVTRAEKVAFQLEQNFLKNGGLLTTLTHSGEQWDAPNGWAPLQWVAFIALRNYRFDVLSDEVKKRWMQNVEWQFSQTGKIFEKYNVEQIVEVAQGGEYLVQDGFGWTNGVYLKMKKTK